MKKVINTTAALLSVSMILCSCGQIDEVSQKVIDDINSIGEVELSDQELIEKIESTYLTLTEKQKDQVDNYAVLLTARDELDLLIKKSEDDKEKVTSVITTAFKVKNNFDTLLTNFDTQGIGMRRSTEKIQIFDITVNDKVWTVSAADADNFVSRDKYVWGSVGIGDSNGQTSDAESCESIIAIEFAQVFPEIENASIKVLLVGAKTKAVAFTEDKNTPLEEGVDCPAFVNGEFDTSFEWSDTAGITLNGLVVGTAPMVGEY